MLGWKVPPRSAVHANYALESFYNREVECRLAELDLITMASLISMVGASQKDYEIRVEALNKIRNSTRDTLNGTAFDPLILAERVRKVVSAQIIESDLLEKVSQLK